MGKVYSPNLGVNYERREKMVGTECTTESKRVYDAEDIQQILGVGRTTAYDFLNRVLRDQHPFRVIKVGRQLRVPCKSFDDWINGANAYDERI